MSTHTVCEVCGAPATNVFGAAADAGAEGGWRLVPQGEVHAYCDGHTPAQPVPVIELAGGDAAPTDEEATLRARVAAWLLSPPTKELPDVGK